MIRLERFYLLAAPLLWSGAAQAQFAKKNPFSVGVNEGSVGEVGRLGMWLLSEQAVWVRLIEKLDTLREPRSKRPTPAMR